VSRPGRREAPASRTPRRNAKHPQMTDRESQPPVQAGDVLAGKYRVERVLGAGGMGVVVQATHLELDERVAMKFLLPHAVESAEAAARFVREREARAAVKIKSEHVARVTDVGRLENGAPYIVMEYLQGSDLSAVLSRGPLSIEDAVDFLLQASDAMAEAHAAGIVHRDLKPSNLFMSMRSDGTPIIKVLDFGISKVNVPDTSDAGLTRTTAIMGSPFYMSPEQMRSSKDVDHRTDIWALGVILYELLTGTQPFNGETLPQLVASILAEPPQSLRGRRPEVPPDLEAVVLHCLEKDRDRRFQSIGALVQALVNFASRRSRHTAERIMRMSGLELPSGSASPLPSASGSSFPSGSAEHGATAPGTTSPGARTNTAWTDTHRGAPQGRTAVLLLGGAAAIALLGGGAFFALRGSSGASIESMPSARPPVAEVGAAPAPPPAPPQVAPVVPPVETALPEPTAAASSSAAARPNSARQPAPRPSARSAPTTPAPPPPPAPAPAPRKNPLSIDLK
jgi:eukaryotic-like serine/threonine-protein kinase